MADRTMQHPALVVQLELLQGQTTTHRLLGRHRRTAQFHLVFGRPLHIVVRAIVRIGERLLPRHASFGQVLQRRLKAETGSEKRGRTPFLGLYVLSGIIARAW